MPPYWGGTLLIIAVLCKLKNQRTNMNQNLKNKIEATDTSISSLLKDQKFYIDYFQREYRWQEKHIKLLVEDLTSTFLKSYKPTDKRPAVANYQSYYLGPV